ncbi:MAG: hypothetical protein CME02_08550 [Geminicoccus sp.]|nr:hypothetical protein [Geminicoccus sp.]
MPEAKSGVHHAAPHEPLLIFRGQAVARLLPVLLGLMSLLAVFFVLQSMQRLFVIQSALRVADGELTVIVPTAPGLPDTTEDPALRRALDVLEATVGLTRIRTLDEAATRRLIGDTLKAGLGAQVPLPAVITLGRTPRVEVSMTELRRVLERAAPGSVLDDNAALRSQLSAQRLAEAGSTAALLAVLLLVVSATTVLTISQSMDLQAPVIEVLLMSGAPDRLIIRQFTGFVWRLALLGAGLGAGTGCGLQLLLWLRSPASDPALTATLLPALVLVAVIIFALIVLLATVTTRWRVTGKLRQSF